MQIVRAEVCSPPPGGQHLDIRLVVLQAADKKILDLARHKVGVGFKPRWGFQDDKARVFWEALGSKFVYFPAGRQGFARAQQDNQTR